jgi:hypothetical protein
MDLMQVFIKEEDSQDDDLLISSTLPTLPGSHGDTFDRWVSSSLYLCGNFGVFFSSYAVSGVLLKTYRAIRQRHGRYKNKMHHIQILG